MKQASKSVDISRLGFLFAKHELKRMFGVDEDAWRKHKWASLVSAGLQAHLLYLKNVDYAIMRNPLTGKQAAVLIDRSTSALPAVPASKPDRHQKVYVSKPSSNLK